MAAERGLDRVFRVLCVFIVGLMVFMVDVDGFRLSACGGGGGDGVLFLPPTVGGV